MKDEQAEKICALCLERDDIDARERLGEIDRLDAADLRKKIDWTIEDLDAAYPEAFRRYLASLAKPTDLQAVSEMPSVTFEQAIESLFEVPPEMPRLFPVDSHSARDGDPSSAQQIARWARQDTALGILQAVIVDGSLVAAPAEWIRWAQTRGVQVLDHDPAKQPLTPSRAMKFLRVAGGNVSQAAREAGYTREYFHRRLPKDYRKRLEVTVKEKRQAKTRG